jgi:Arc/MetJ family transcription regulator
MLRTNIELDERLVAEALKLTRKKTKKEVVNYALEELVRKLKRKKLHGLKGKVEWVGDLDEMRRSRI